jgi:hypothetical protein
MVRAAPLPLRPVPKIGCPLLLANEVEPDIKPVEAAVEHHALKLLRRPIPPWLKDDPVIAPVCIQVESECATGRLVNQNGHEKGFAAAMRR